MLLCFAAVQSSPVLSVTLAGLFFFSVSLSLFYCPSCYCLICCRFMWAEEVIVRTEERCSAMTLKLIWQKCGGRGCLERLKRRGTEPNGRATN